MPNRSIIFRIADNYFSVPFDHVDEIVGMDKVYSREEIPPAELPQGAEDRKFVTTRIGWLPIRAINTAERDIAANQILVFHGDDRGGAFPVDQMFVVEDMPESAPVPLPARKCTDFPILGACVWKGRIVLELDLSQLI